MSCAEIRARSPNRCTVPSTTASTPNSRAISETDLFRTDLYCMAEVLETTRNALIFASDVISASVSPSAKYSCSGSPERFSKGRTAKDRIRLTGVGCPASIFPIKRYPRRGAVSMYWGFSAFSHQSLAQSFDRVIETVVEVDKSVRRPDFLL